jgi:hypothetical protein
VPAAGSRVGICTDVLEEEEEESKEIDRHGFLACGLIGLLDIIKYKIHLKYNFGLILHSLRWTMMRWLVGRGTQGNDFWEMPCNPATLLGNL